MGIGGFQQNTLKVFRRNMSMKMTGTTTLDAGEKEFGKSVPMKMKGN